jgi:hypothetical protein
MDGELSLEKSIASRILQFSCFFSLKEVEWSLQLAEEIANTPWDCVNCGGTFSTSAIEKLQHKKGKKI